MHAATRPALAVATLLVLGIPTVGPAFGADGEIPRMPDGRPDLSGTYDIATLTPLSRPAKYGDKLYLTPEEAAEIERREAEFRAKADQSSDPNREAPSEGGDLPFAFDGSEPGLLAASGNVGGYNGFWIDRGDSVVEVDGQFRTSIITEPANGQQPPIVPSAMPNMRALADQFHPNDGTAFWLEWDRPGPYDDMEVRPLPERCLLTFSSAVPALPSLYNNTKRIVQTADEVMILNEMVHDARVVRLDSEHPPAEMKSWLGDSIGWWEGDTLVVETTNFKTEPGGYYYGPVDRLKVIERFTRWDEKTLHYAFEVENPDRWTAAWKGDFTWPSIDGAPHGRVYEYACHEGNYALGNIMRGARLLEREAAGKSSE
jgi:hypothetical protein